MATQEMAWDKSNPSLYKASDTVPSTFDPSPIVVTLPAGYRSLIDTITDSQGEDGRFRSCLHTTETNSFVNARVPIHTFNCASSDAACRDVSVTDVNNALGYRVLPTLNWTQLGDIATAFMLPRLNEGTSLVNFILELKDLKHSNPLPSLRRIWSRKLPLRELATSRHTRKQFAKELVNRLTGAHLNASFGIVPFVGDIVQMFDDLSDLHNKLTRLRQYAGKPQVRHYKRVLPDNSGNPVTTAWTFTNRGCLWPGNNIVNDVPGGGSRVVSGLAVIIPRARWVERPVYHATMRYIYTLDDMSELEGKVASFLDVLGVRLDPGIVWNAIPFSFLVDWVVDVSSFLRSFARDNFPIHVRITDFCHSVRSHSEHEVQILYGNYNINPKPPYPPKPVNYTWTFYHGMRRYYDRRLYVPNVNSVQARTPRLKQLALSGSLFLNKGHTRYAGKAWRSASPLAKPTDGFIPSSARLPRWIYRPTKPNRAGTIKSRRGLPLLF